MVKRRLFFSLINMLHVIGCWDEVLSQFPQRDWCASVRGVSVFLRVCGVLFIFYLSSGCETYAALDLAPRMRTLCFHPTQFQHIEALIQFTFKDKQSRRETWLSADTLLLTSVMSSLSTNFERLLQNKYFISSFLNILITSILLIVIILVI